MCTSATCRDRRIAMALQVAADLARESLTGEGAAEAIEAFARALELTCCVEASQIRPETVPYFIGPVRHGD